MTYLPIILIIVLIATIVVLLRLGYKKQVADILFYLVCKAEAQLGGGTGQLKFAAVSAWIWEKLPWYLQLVFPTREIDKLIEAAVVRMKDYLTNNKKASELLDTSILA